MAELPDLIGKYRITQLIAQGGMGAVYKAVHPTLKRNVILKKLTIRGNPQFIERFKREARIMMDFKHDNIVTVYDHFKEGSSYYIVLEYVDGFSLEELIRKERAISSAMAMHIFLEISRALKYAHDNGVIHRDIKPANILISKKGEIKLVDFGIAGYEAEGEGADENLTTQGMTLGTVSYMPPEQFENTKNVDKGADIYAMGIMLYEMVTGKKPFPGNFSPDTLLLIKRGKYIRVRKMNPKVDGAIGRLTAKMIRPKKEQRYRDLAPVIRILRDRLKREDRDELEKKLIAIMNGTIYTEPKRRVRKLARRIFGLGLPGLILLAAAAGWVYFSGTWFELFFPADYGALTIEVPYPSDQDMTIHPVEASLVPDGKTKAVASPVAMPSLLETAYSLVGIAKPGVVSSGKLYLKPGLYVLNLAVSQKLYRESFYLQPFQVQKSEGRAQGMILSYPYTPPHVRPLSLDIKVLDSRMRQDISATALISLRAKNGEWVSPDFFPKDELVSGRSYQCKVLAYGFHSQEFKLNVAAQQTEARIEVALVPIEGRLKLSTQLNDLKITINGRGSVVSGGLQPQLTTLQANKTAGLSIPLAPGPLRLEVQSGDRKGSIDITIISDATLKLAVSAGSGSKDLIIKELP